MSRRAVRLGRRAAEALRGEPAVEPLPIEEYDPDSAGTAEARAILDRWRPALYSYGGHLLAAAEPAFAALRHGPFGIVNVAWADGRLLAEPVTELPAGGPMWDRYTAIRRGLMSMARAANRTTIADRRWIEEQGLQGADQHLRQLLRLFSELDHRIDGAASARYATPADFAFSGQETGIDILLKTEHLARRVVALDSDAHWADAVAAATTLPERLAALGLDALRVADESLTACRIAPMSSRSVSATRPYDAAAFGARRRTREAVPMIEPLVAIDDLPDPRTIAARGTDPYDLDAPERRTVADVVAASQRHTLGCLATQRSEEDGTTVLDEYRGWIGGIARHLSDEHLRRRRAGEEPEPMTPSAARLTAERHGLAARMPDLGLHRRRTEIRVLAVDDLEPGPDLLERAGGSRLSHGSLTAAELSAAVNDLPTGEQDTLDVDTHFEVDRSSGLDL